MPLPVQQHIALSTAQHHMISQFQVRNFVFLVLLQIKSDS